MCFSYKVVNGSCTLVNGLLISSSLLEFYSSFIFLALFRQSGAVDAQGLLYLKFQGIFLDILEILDIFDIPDILDILDNLDNLDILDSLGILDIFQRAVYEVLVPWPCSSNPELMTLNELL